MKKISHLIMIHDLASLDFNLAKDSSSRYVISLAQSLKKKIDRISIVSSKCSSDIQDGNITLCKCDPFKLWNFKNVYKYIIHNLVNNNASDDSIVFLMWGYNPALLHYALKLKKYGKVISIIYDAHEGALNQKKVIKSHLVNEYYCFGRRMVNHLNGVISFNTRAKEELNLRIPFLHSLPFVDLACKSTIHTTANDDLKFLYAGTLCDYNLSVAMAEAFSDTMLGNEKLYICGDGPNINYVKHICDINSHIKYLGRMDKKTLDELIQNIDVFVCLRDTESVVCKYSFPSKLPEYMQYGKPILCSKISSEELFLNSVFLVEGNTKEDIIDCIKTIRRERQRFKEKTDYAFEYLRLYHNSEVISKKILCFMDNIININ